MFTVTLCGLSSWALSVSGVVVFVGEPLTSSVWHHGELTGA